MSIPDLGGNTLATVVLPSSGFAAAITDLAGSDEFGYSTSSPDSGVAKYGWGSAAQLPSLRGGLVGTGSCLYNPKTGRFTSTDGVRGGNENLYSYPNDPINRQDYSGDKWVFYSTKNFFTGEGEFSFSNYVGPLRFRYRSNSTVLGFLTFNWVIGAGHQWNFSVATRPGVVCDYSYDAFYKNLLWNPNRCSLTMILGASWRASPIYDIDGMERSHFSSLTMSIYVWR